MTTATLERPTETPAQETAGLSFTLPRQDLHRAIQTVIRAVRPNSPLPILSHVLLEANGDKLQVTANDQETGIVVQVPADIAEPGKATVPARLLSEVLGDLPNEPVRCEVDGRQNLSLSCGCSCFTLAGLSPEDFPQVNPMAGTNGTIVPADLLREVAKQVLFCVSDDITRPQLTGVYLHLKDGIITAASTDTHRLSVRTFPAPTQEPENIPAGKQELIVPAKALDLFLRAADGEQAGLDFGASQIRMVGQNVVVVSRLIEGAFPNYERVIPDHFDRIVTVDREQMLRAVRRVLIVARGEKSNRIVIRCGADWGMSLTAESAGLGTAKEELTAQVGGDVELAFNGEYLKDALEVLTDKEIQIRVSGALTPVLIRGESDDYRHILMPMQLAGGG